MATPPAILLKPLAPLLASLRGYNAAALRGDVLAGLTVAVIAIPQSMAYAVIAGVPAQYGLYTVIIQCLVGSLFNSMRLLSVGPINTQSLLVASTVTLAMREFGELPPDRAASLYLQLVLALTILKGAMQLVFAAARLGVLVRYVSTSVLVGFTAGAGVLIAAGQLGHFLGIHTDRNGELWPGLIGIAQQIGPHLAEVNVRAVGLGVLALAIVLGAGAISRLVPGPLLAVAVTGAVVASLGWSDAQVPLLPPLPSGLPAFSAPVEGLGHWDSLFSGALALSLLGLMEAYAIGRSIAAKTGDRVSANQELFAQGLTNLVSGFFQCIPGSGSFSRTALNYYAGAKTGFSGIFNAAFVAVIFLLAVDYARYVPLTTLAAILFVIAAGLIDWRYFRRLLRSERADAVVCLGTFLATLLLPLAYAVFVGVFLNLALYLRKASQLHMAEMVRTKAGSYVERPLTTKGGGESDVIFIQMEGDLFFALADELQDRLTDLTMAGYKVVIFRLKRTHSIDATILAVLEAWARRMQQQGRHIILCGLKEELLDKLKAYGLVDLIGRANVFPTGYGVFTSAKAALHRAREILGSSIDEEGLGDDQDDDDPKKWSYSI